MKSQRNGKCWERSQHSYPDSELIDGITLRKMLGVSSAAITKAKQSGRLDTFKNSHGKECFHQVLSVQQYQLTRDRRHVTTATTGQKAAGFDDETAQAVAHLPEFDNPRGEFGEPLPTMAPPQTVDLGEAWSERIDLATSKAQKEFYAARLMKLKMDEAEGRLVPKQVAAIAVYQLAANVQDKIMNIFSVLAPEVVGFFKDAMEQNGIEQSTILAITENSEHVIGEKIRKSCLNALKDLTSKNAENILDG